MSFSIEQTFPMMKKLFGCKKVCSTAEKKKKKKKKKKFKIQQKIVQFNSSSFLFFEIKYYIYKYKTNLVLFQLLESFNPSQKFQAFEN